MSGSIVHSIDYLRYESIEQTSVMISIQKRFLFIHVPKTGGNSIQNILRDYSEDDIVILAEYQDGVERFEVRNRKFNITKHSTLTHYKSVLDSTTYRSLFKFATIRNPWDMMISLYFSPHRGITEWRRDSFLTLVKNTPTLRHYIHEKSLSEKALSILGIQSAKNKRNLCSDIDFLLRFERLEDDFVLICKKLNIPPCPLIRRNSSDRKHYSRYYDDELREVIRKKFIEEITFGDYRFKNA